MASERMVWRPIDTAEKKDGPILLSDGAQVGIAEWREWGPLGEGLWDFVTSVGFEPTYWMPLPPPPTTQSPPEAG